MKTWKPFVIYGLMRQWLSVIQVRATELQLCHRKNFSAHQVVVAADSPNHSRTKPVMQILLAR